MKKILKEVVFGTEESSTKSTSSNEDKYEEIRNKEPVVQEHVTIGEREEIQPVIHREIDKTEIHEVIQPIYERQDKPTIVEEKVLPAEYKPEIRESIKEPMKESPKSEIKYEKKEKETYIKPTIVEEEIHKRIIEEIQPVIHRETRENKVIKEVQPIYERIIEAPKFIYEEREPLNRKIVCKCNQLPHLKSCEMYNMEYSHQGIECTCNESGVERKEKIYYCTCNHSPHLVTCDLCSCKELPHLTNCFINKLTPKETLKSPEPLDVQLGKVHLTSDPHHYLHVHQKVGVKSTEKEETEKPIH